MASFSLCWFKYKQRQHEFILSDMEMVSAPSRCESHMNNILSPSYKTLPKKYASVEWEFFEGFLFFSSCSESLTWPPEKVSVLFLGPALAAPSGQLNARWQERDVQRALLQQNGYTNVSALFLNVSKVKQTTHACRGKCVLIFCSVNSSQILSRTLSFSF